MGQCFGTGVGPDKAPVLHSDADWAHAAYGWIAIDGRSVVRQEQAEGVLAAVSVTEGLGQIALAGEIRASPLSAQAKEAATFESLCF